LVVVFAPYETIRGQAPRRIEVERKKRLYASVDITEILNEKNVLTYLEKKSFGDKKDGLPLYIFDNTEFESRPMEEWVRYVRVSKAGLPARATKVGSKGHISWEPCMVKDFDENTSEFLVEFSDSGSVSGEDSPLISLTRLYICFNSEDPIEYCKRLQWAVLNERQVKELIALNLYVDCMPVDNLKPLDSEQVNRILLNSMNIEKLRANTSLDSISLIQQYNLNHMRSLNKLVMIRALQSQLNDVRMVQTASINYELLLEPWHIPNFENIIDFPSDYGFQERNKSFKFNSLLNKSEAISIISLVQRDNYNIKKGTFFSVPEKTVRLEEYSLTQQNSLSTCSTQIKDFWMNNVTATVRRYLKDVKKGWYNIEESNVEVYNFSKLRKFLYRINFQMEDTLRDFLLLNLAEYRVAIKRCCPQGIVVVSNDLVTVEAAERLPLLTVDLKFIGAAAASSDKTPAHNSGSGGNGNGGQPTNSTIPAHFLYASPPQAFVDAILHPFDQIFELLKGIIKIEKRVMKNLFWSHDPIMRVPHCSEDWVQGIRNDLLDTLQRSITIPMESYLQTLTPFLDLISIDIDEYTLQAERKYCPSSVSSSADDTAAEGGAPVGGNMDLNGLCALACQHISDAEKVFNAFPSSINLGIIMVDLKALKKMLAQKHTSIATKLFEIQIKAMRVYVENIQNQFRAIFDKICVTPSCIEHLAELREFMQTIPTLVHGLADKITKNDQHFQLLSDAKCRLSHDDMDLQWEVAAWPLKISVEMAKQEKNFKVLETQFKNVMTEEQEEFAHLISSLQVEVSKLKDLSSIKQAAVNAETVRRIKASLKTTNEKAQLFLSREVLFGVTELTEYNELGEIARVLDPFYDLWDSADKWLSNKEIWTNGPFTELDADSLEQSVSTLLRNLNKSGKTLERLNLSQCSTIAEQVRKEVEEFRPKVPLITALRNPGMRDRHWNDLGEKLNVKIPAKKSEMTLQSLCDMGMLETLADVQKISEKAGKEFSIEKALDKMQSAWETVPLVIEPYRDTGTCILKGIDEYMALLDEHITMTQAMAFSAFKGPFEERIDKWNHTLQVVSEVVDEWTQLQRNWLYLQPIFDSPDINKQLPQEGKRFTTVDKYWKQTMTSAAKGVLTIRFCDDSRLLDRFREGNKLLEMVQKGLADYLETKRAGFSRFYFLSNDELLEILSETKDPLRVQPHLRKCFEGIKGVDFQSDMTITGMTSPEGERVPFLSPVDPKNKNIEHWMVEVLNAMVAGVRDNMICAIVEYPKVPRTDWMQKWAAQCVLNGSQFHWTREAEAAMTASGNEGVWSYYEQLCKQLADMVILIRGKISKLARVTVGALAVVDVHARDVQKKMAEAGVSSISDFDWIAQMRYYWSGDISKKEGDLDVIMVSSKRKYGYEYLGNTFRLVITPLTDKCYLTLMGALQMILGGAPAGPAGTGKTETTKDLAKALAKQCVVFNCSDGLDYMAMGKFFKGLASSGAWACFDEFNRINIEVLSVIAQQVIQLQSTVQRGEPRTVFEGTDILVNPEFAVFITMNPGYAGRAELPDNLEALFRPVAMMVPDYALIGEIMLFSYGYMENRKCALKMVATFRLCSEQLSSQDHYDYGMRAVKTVITAAGNLKRASPDENEEALLMRALQDVNTPKFLAHDLPLFEGILSDLFPGIQRPAFDYGPLLESLKHCIHERNLQPIQVFLLKNIELYEMICVRHGLMVVGPTGGGKSSNIRTLASALSHLKANDIQGVRYEKTKIYHLNPKSIKMGQLYGEFDENTHEWQDGILCVLIRMCIKDDNSNLKWMLFDGPVDAIWIENMNTVLDDNKKLCLTSGEIIQLSEPMTMMFEPEDLAVASPATVSRCGMVYMEPTSLGYDVLLQSWLNKTPSLLGEKFRGMFQMLFDKFVPSLLGFLRRYCTEPLPTVNNCLVDALLHLMDTFNAEFYEKEDGSENRSSSEIEQFLTQLPCVFIFCLIWSLGCTGDAVSRKMVDSFLRAEITSFGYDLGIPREGLLYDYKFDLISNAWIKWSVSIPPYEYDPKLSFAELIIPIDDSICYTFLLDTLIKKKKHVLMTGPTGTGKTVNIQGLLQNGLPEKYIPITMSFSAQTSANQTQDLIDSKCEKRRKGVFGPSAGKEFVIFVDDVNMPMKEEYGAQPPIEILRQWFDNGGWYDRKALEMRKIVDVIYVCACGPPGGGRNHVTARFYRHFNIINYVDLSDNSLRAIFNTIFTNFLSVFDSSLQEPLSSSLVSASVEVFNTILNELRPTPAKPHYVFNMRDLSKVFQGLLMIDRRRVSTPVGLCRVWVHENQRVFGDRLINETDKTWLLQTLEEKFTASCSSASLSMNWNSLWETSPTVIITDFMIPGADPKVYDEVDDLPTLQAQVEEYLSEYNGESKQPMHLVMFSDALMHVTKISRILRQPSGHALLLGVGGSGRQSLTRLSAFISGYKLYQIEIAKGYGMNEWRENVKECLLLAGAQNLPVVFLFNDTQIINETMLEDINGILNSGDVPNLYTVEDQETIANACRPDCQRKKIPPTKLNIFSQYLLRVKANIHVVLCMSPLGNAFRTRLRMFPSIVNCCTIDWFMEWPDDALQSVARQFLASSNLGLSHVEDSIVNYFQFLHQSIEKASVEFLATMRRPFYVTPTSYLELLSTYQKVLTDKRKEVGTLRDRLQVGVEKLVSTEKQVNELQATLTEMEPKLIQTQADVEEMIIQITNDKASAAETKAVVEIEEASAAKKAADTQAIADDAQRDLDEALPALAVAVQCLKDLKKADIDEVKSLTRPPQNVVKTLQACCIMFDIKPDRVNDPDNPGKKINDWFKVAQRNLLVSANKLLEDMQNYDKDNIPADIIAKIEPFYNDPTFTPEIIEKASKACKAMCMWTRAMYKYHQVVLVVEPKKQQLAAAQASLDETMIILNRAQATLASAEARIAQLESQFNEANDKKEQLVVDVSQCRARLERAVKLMGGLGGERT
jgi:dynein heavy chain, axonemal